MEPGLFFTSRKSWVTVLDLYSNPLFSFFRNSNYTYTESSLPITFITFYLIIFTSLFSFVFLVVFILLFNILYYILNWIYSPLDILKFHVHLKKLLLLEFHSWVWSILFHILLFFYSELLNFWFKVLFHIRRCLFKI